MSKHLRNQRRVNAMKNDPVLDITARDVASENEANADSTVSAESFSALDDNSSEKAKVTDLGTATVAGDIAKDDTAVSFAADDSHNLNGDDPDRVPVVPELPDDQVPNMPGAILKHAREMLGLSQREVVERLNIESKRLFSSSERIVIRVNTISDIEHDRLNQSTAVTFVVKIIKLYANLVNIDSKALTDLYMQNVNQSQKTASINAQRITKQEHKASFPVKKIALLSAGAIVLLGLGIGIGALVSTSSSDEESTSGALTLSQSAQQEMVEHKVSEDPFPPEAEGTEAPLDPNTEMARAQAQALGTDDIIADVHKTEAEKKTESLANNGTLSVEPPKGKNTAVPSANTQIQPEFTAPNENLSALLTAPEVKTHDAVAPQDQRVTDGGLPTAKPVNAMEERKSAAPTVNAQNKTKQDTEKKDKAKTQDNKDKEQPAVLSASVRDVSGAVRIVNRNDIGSLNTVTVKIKGPVSLRIKSNGRVLKSGNYKAGDTVSVTGMPPLRVEVSDSSKITVRYNGGTAAAPSGKNIGYDLPTR